MSALWQTLIGGALSIVGGLLAVWWQSHRADKVARRVRRQERREDGLLTLYPVVAEVYKDVDQARSRVEQDPDAWLTAWPDLYKELERLTATWNAHGAGKIPDRSVVDAYMTIRGQIHNCVSRFGTPGEARVITATREDCVREAGGLLVAVAELKTAIEDQLQELR